MTKWEYFEVERPPAQTGSPRTVRYLVNGIHVRSIASASDLVGDDAFSEVVATLGSLDWDLVTILLANANQPERWAFKREIRGYRPTDPSWLS